MASSNPLWAELVEKHYEQIYRFCVHFLGSQAEGEDVTQEVFERAFQALPSLKDLAATKSWLYSIARHQCIDRSRWWKRYLKFLNREERSELQEPMSDLSIMLQRLISELPDRQREVFILRHLHDFSTEEAAGLLKISAGTVKSHLKRAVDTLKLRFQEVESVYSRTTKSSAETSIIP